MNFKLSSKSKKGQKKFGLFTTKPQTTFNSSNTTISQTELNKRAKKRKIDSQLKKIQESNPNIFDYDSYYTNTLTNERAKKRQKTQQEKITREVKYITSMKKNAEIRKKRIGIIEERKNYKNRQKTDHLFGNKKDAYITKSFKKYLKDTKLQELKDNFKEENNKTIQNSDGFGFYNNLLDMKIGKNEENKNESNKKNEDINEIDNDLNTNDEDNNDGNKTINEGENEFKKKEEGYYREKYLKEYEIVRKTDNQKQKEIEKSVLEKCKNNLTKKDIDEKRARYLERLKKKKQQSS